MIQDMDSAWHRFTNDFASDSGQQILAYDEVTGRCEVVTWLHDNWHPRKGSPFSFTHWQHFCKPETDAKPLRTLFDPLMLFIAYDYDETILYRSEDKVVFARVNFRDRTYVDVLSVYKAPPSQKDYHVDYRSVADCTFEMGNFVEYRIAADETFGLAEEGDIEQAELIAFDGDHAILFFAPNKQTGECGMYSYVKYDSETKQFVRKREGRCFFLAVPESDPSSTMMRSALFNKVEM